MTSKPTVYVQRGYSIKNVTEAKRIVKEFLTSEEITDYKFGLPEVDDRYHVWRVPIIDVNKLRLGEIVLDARSGELDAQKSTDAKILREKIAISSLSPIASSQKKKIKIKNMELTEISNTILHYSHNILR